MRCVNIVGVQSYPFQATRLTRRAPPRTAKIIKLVERGSDSCSRRNLRHIRRTCRASCLLGGISGPVSHSPTSVSSTDEGLGKTEYSIDTWSYQYGLAEGYIPSDVSNRSTLAYPVLDNGCVDAGFNYTAPKKAGSKAMRRTSWVWSWTFLGVLLVIISSINDNRLV